MSKVSAADITDLIRFLFTLRWRQRGGGYIAFGKLGVLMVALGVSILTPSVWEIIVEALVRASVEDRDDVSPIVRLVLAAVVIAAGLWAIWTSFRSYHEVMKQPGKSLENEGAIATNVLPGTSLAALISATAEQRGMSVDLGSLTPAERALAVAPGPLQSSSFKQFLSQIGERTNPSLRLKWTRTGNFYRIST